MRLILFVLFVCFLQTTKAATYYFSAVSGDDSRTSTQAKNSSTPWKSLSKLNSFFSSLQPGDAVLLKRGETFYGSIVVKKSGTSGSPIVIGAYGSGSRPVITSLVTLSGWVSKGNGIWESYNSSLSTTVNTVLLNGVEQELGRYPNSNATNKGYLNFESHSGNTSITDNQLTSSPNWTGAELVIRARRWVINRNLITSHSGSKITYSTTSSYSGINNYGYFIQKSIKTLDKLGEWYYNPSAKKLSVYFGSGGPSSYSVQATSKDNLIHSQKFSNVVFDNLNIKGANVCGVYIKYGSNIHVKNSDILFSGEDGVQANYHANLKIENCTISNSNVNGIDLGYVGDNAIIRNNKIINTSVFRGMGGNGDAQGIAIFCNGNNNIIENNKILNTGYSGIKFNGNYVTIKNNFIDNFCMTKDDGAGIYTWTGSANTIHKGRKVIGNIIINGRGASEGTNNRSAFPAEGVYLDVGTSGVEVTGNTVANCSNQGFFIQNSHEITVKNNTVFNSDSRQLAMVQKPDLPKTRNCIISDNIFFSKETSQLLLYLGSSAEDTKYFGRFSGNYYARPSDSKNQYYLDKIKVYDPYAKLKTFTGTVRFEYNGTGAAKTVALDASYIDAKNNNFSGSVTLQPFTSVVLIKTGQTIPNTSPVVSITSPTSNTSFKSGATINISAKASDADGYITKLQFYKGTTLLHTESSAPYSWNWTNVSSGSYILTAKATDNSGHVTTSTGVKISVVSSKPSISNNDTANLEIAVPNKNKLLNFRLFPNPAVNVIKINFEEYQINQKANLSIVSMSGSILKSLPLILSGKTIEIDISSLSSGTYIMRLTSDNFEMNKKFVKMY